MNTEETVEQMRDFAEYIDRHLPNNVGFTLITFETGVTGGLYNYVSNCNRKDMVDALRDAVDQIERGQDHKLN